MGGLEVSLGAGQWGEGMTHGEFEERSWDWLAKSLVSLLKSTALILQLVEHTQGMDSLGRWLTQPPLLFLSQEHTGV